MEGSGWVVEKNKDSECSTLVTYVANVSYYNNDPP